MQENYDDTVVETGSGEHVNPDGETDAQKGMKGGGIGGALVGAAAGSMMGPAGALLGAAVGGIVGAVASGAAVAVVDRVDGDSATDYNPEPVSVDTTTLAEHRYHDNYDTVGNGIPGVQTGGHAVDGTPDTRGMAEKAADAVTGDYIDDKTGKPVTDVPPPIIDNGMPGIQTGGHTVDGTMDTRGMTEKAADAVTGDYIDDKTGKVVADAPRPMVDNGMPGIQTGGYANDGSPDTRGVTEKAADAITGDYIDGKTGKVVSDGPAPIIDNGIPGVQTGGHATDGTPDTRGIGEKTADALTGDNVDDKTGKRVS